MGGMPPRNFEFAFSPEREKERGRERVAGKGNRGERLSSRPSPRPPSCSFGSNIRCTFFAIKILRDLVPFTRTFPTCFWNFYLESKSRRILMVLVILAR